MVNLFFLPLAECSLIYSTRIGLRPPVLLDTPRLSFAMTQFLLYPLRA